MKKNKRNKKGAPPGAPAPHPQRAALVHAFFAERAVAKIPEKDATPREVASLAVIGGGTMGSSIRPGGEGGLFDYGLMFAGCAVTAFLAAKLNVPGGMMLGA